MCSSSNELDWFLRVWDIHNLHIPLSFHTYLFMMFRHIQVSSKPFVYNWYFLKTFIDPKTLTLFKLVTNPKNKSTIKYEFFRLTWSCSTSISDRFSSRSLSFSSPFLSRRPVVVLLIFKSAAETVLPKVRRSTVSAKCIIASSHEKRCARCTHREAFAPSNPTFNCRQRSQRTENWGLVTSFWRDGQTFSSLVGREGPGEGEILGGSYLWAGGHTAEGQRSGKSFCKYFGKTAEVQPK